jgi:hypothetical protein
LQDNLCKVFDFLVVLVWVGHVDARKRLILHPTALHALVFIVLLKKISSFFKPLSREDLGLKKLVSSQDNVALCNLLDASKKA